jgi:hypothetical protein
MRLQAVLAALAIAGAANARPRWQAGILVASLCVWVVLLWLRLELGVESSRPGLRVEPSAI